MWWDMCNCILRYLLSRNPRSLLVVAMVNTIWDPCICIWHVPPRLYAYVDMITIVSSRHSNILKLILINVETHESSGTVYRYSHRGTWILSGIESYILYTYIMGSVLPLISTFSRSWVKSYELGLACYR